MNGLPVTIRTVDIGADKPLDRMSVNELRHEHALNPALGLRAIRWSLSGAGHVQPATAGHPAGQRYGKVRLLSSPWLPPQREVKLTLDALARAKRQLTDAGRPYVDVGGGGDDRGARGGSDAAGVPAHFDFVSIGTNDLIQYTLAIDRADESVAHLYDPWHPAVLALVAAHHPPGWRAGKARQRVREMAGDPAFTELLLGMGLRSFSMHPRRSPPSSSACCAPTPDAPLRRPCDELLPRGEVKFTSIL